MLFSFRYSTHISFFYPSLHSFLPINFEWDIFQTAPKWLLQLFLIKVPVNAAVPKKMDGEFKLANALSPMEG